MQPQSYPQDRHFALPLLAGLAITAPFWAGRRCCPPFAPFPYFYPLPVPFITPSPYFFYHQRPFMIY